VDALEVLRVVEVLDQCMVDVLDGVVNDKLLVGQRALLQRAAVGPRGFEPDEVRSPVLFLHGGQDRIAPSSHAKWLSGHVRSAELWLRPDEGHISILSSGTAALDWLGDHALRSS
jgi:pimeloyl-ACP methyl ester carboxylesterase